MGASGARHSVRPAHNNNNHRHHTKRRPETKVRDELPPGKVHTTVGPPPPPTPSPPVIVVGSDGLSARAAEYSDEFTDIIAGSEYTLRCRTCEHTRSWECWRAILMGGYDANIDVSSQRPALFDHIKSQNSSKTLWVLGDYYVIFHSVNSATADYSKLIGGSDKAVDDFLDKVSSEGVPDLAVLYFMDCDNAGHKHSWDSGPYRDAVEVVGAQIKRLRAAVPNAIIFVVSDHGGRGGGHGYSGRNMGNDDSNIDSPVFRRTPFIRWDPSRTPRPLCDVVRNDDLVVEVAKIMHIEPHVSWRMRAGWLPASFPCTPDDVAPVVSGANDSEVWWYAAAAVLLFFCIAW